MTTEGHVSLATPAIPRTLPRLMMGDETDGGREDSPRQTNTRPCRLTAVGDTPGGICKRQSPRGKINGRFAEGYNMAVATETELFELGEELGIVRRLLCTSFFFFFCLELMFFFYFFLVRQTGMPVALTKAAVLFSSSRLP